MWRDKWRNEYANKLFITKNKQIYLGLDLDHYPNDTKCYIIGVNPINYEQVFFNIATVKALKIKICSDKQLVKYIRLKLMNKLEINKLK